MSFYFRRRRSRPWPWFMKCLMGLTKEQEIDLLLNLLTFTNELTAGNILNSSFDFTLNPKPRNIFADYSKF